MAEISRREFFKYAGLVGAVSLAGISIAEGTPKYIEPEKRKVIGEMMQGVVSQKERYQRAAEMNRDSMTLMKAMMNDEHLWDDALPGQDYIVGVAEGRERGILRASKHYFSDGRECGDFIKQCARDGKAFHCDSRNKHYFC